MRPATLYTLHSQKVMAGDHMQLAYAGMRPLLTSNPNEAVAFNTVDANVPIHRIRRCIKPDIRPLSGDPLDYKYEDFFIAMEPALAEIMEAPFRAEVDAARAEADAAYTKRREAEIRMIRFRLLPWWRRLWLAFKRTI